MHTCIARRKSLAGIAGETSVLHAVFACEVAVYTDTTGGALERAISTE